MCVVSGAEADIKPDPSFQLLLVCSSGMGLILQGLFKLNCIGPIEGVSTEVPIALTGINFSYEEQKTPNIVICSNKLELFPYLPDKERLTLQSP